MEYLIIIILLLYYTYIHDIKGEKRNRKKHLNILFLLIFLLAGLRHGMGGDTYQFRIFWETLPSLDYVTWRHLTIYRYDMGWVLLSFVMKVLFGSFVSLQLLLSFILNKGIFKIVERYSSYPFFCLLLFFVAGEQFFNIEFVFMRQAFGVAFFLLWGVDYLVKKNHFKYILVVILCTLMHFSSIILIVLPLFWNLDFSNKKTNKRMITSIITFLILIIVTYNFAPFIFVKSLDRFNNDIGNINITSSNEFIRIFNTIYLYLAYYTIILFGVKKLNIKIKFKGALYFSFFLCMIAPYVGDTLRIMFFIIIFIDIILANIFTQMIKRNQLNYFICILGFVAVSNILFYQRYSSKEFKLFIYPYYSWFEEEPDSHKKYMTKRKRDGYTISHQIYNFNK